MTTRSPRCNPPTTGNEVPGPERTLSAAAVTRPAAGPSAHAPVGESANASITNRATRDPARNQRISTPPRNKRPVNRRTSALPYRPGEHQHRRLLESIAARGMSALNQRHTLSRRVGKAERTDKNQITPGRRAPPDPTSGAGGRRPVGPQRAPKAVPRGPRIRVNTRGCGKMTCGQTLRFFGRKVKGQRWN